MAFAFVAFAAVALAVPSAEAAGGSAPYIVAFRDDAVAQRGPLVAHPNIDAGRVGQLVSTIARGAGIVPTNVYTSVLGGFAASLTPGQVAALQANPAVDSVTPDTAVSLEADETGFNAQEWLVSLTSPKVPAGIRRIGATQSAIADINGGGGRVNADVAVIDTGIERDHPDLNVVGGYNCTSSNRAAWDDGNGHGTHVAGTIGALDNGLGVVGVAPGVRLWAVKVLDSTGNGLLSWIVCGVDWISSQRVGTNGSRPLIDVANMSLRSPMPAGGDDHNCGWTIRDNLHRAICRSVAGGTVYVVAAGNDHDDARNYRPAGYDEVITVSAMSDYDGRPGGLATRPAGCPAGYPDDTWAGFSNFGPAVDLTAPGICVLSTWAGKQYAYASGTSMAAPHVTGAVALYRVQYPSAKPQQVKMALQHVAHTDWKLWTAPDRYDHALLWATDFSAPPDFTVNAGAGSGYSGLNSTIAVSVNVDRMRGHNAPVTLSISDLPASMNASDVTATGSSATMYVEVGSFASSGSYTLTVTGDDGELTHSATVTIRIDGSPPAVKFTSPGSNRIQSTKSAKVSWTESDSGSGIAGRVLWRQRSAPKVPGSCDGLTYHNVGFPRTSFGTYTDPVYSGYCYRWSLTVRDHAGNFTTVYSPTVLVDSSAPSKPSATVSASSSSVVPARGVSLPSAYVDGNGTLWLRGGGSGTLDLLVQSNDPISGVASMTLTPTTSTSGWTFPRTLKGGSATAHFTYGASAVPLGISIRATNAAGLTSYATTFRTTPDGTAPSGATWSAPAAGPQWYSPDGAVILRWSGGSDSGSGLASLSYVRRQRAPVTSSGGCGLWSNDGSPRLLPNGYEETGLPTAYCFRWIERNSDRVGNLSSAVTSGVVLVDKVSPKVTIYKPLPGPTIIKTRTTQTVSWTASDAGGSKLASVTVQRQRATSHPAGTCVGATWKLDGTARQVPSPLYETGLVAGSCYRWVVTAIDHATNSTAVTTGAVLISGATTSSTGSTAPTVGNLTVVPSTLGMTPADMVRLSANWTADGGAGNLTGYQLRVSADGGATWGTYTPPNGATPQMTIQLPAGRTWNVEVRAANDLGAWSAWSAPAAFALGLAEGESSGFQKVGTWKSAALSGASGGAVTYSTTAGDIIRYTFSGESVALVSTLGPNRGMADIYIDGWRTATIDLYAPALTTRQIVFTQNWATSDSHVISLQVRGTAGRPRVDVDAVVVLN